MWLSARLARNNPKQDRGWKMQRRNFLRCEDEPPNQICHVKGNHYNNWCVEHTGEHFRRLLLGEGRYFTGLVVLCAQIVVALADGYIWFWVLENMRNRMQGEPGKQDSKDAT